MTALVIIFAAAAAVFFILMLALAINRRWLAEWFAEEIEVTQGLSPDAALADAQATIRFGIGVLAWACLVSLAGAVSYSSVMQ